MAVYEQRSDEKYYMYMDYVTIKKSEGYVVLPHFHNASEINVIVEGKYFAKIGESEVVLEAGDILFVDSFLPHSGKVVDELKEYVLVLDNQIVKHLALGFDDKYKTLPMIMKSGEYFPEILELLEKGLKTFYGGEKGRSWAFFNRFVSMLVQNFGVVDKQQNKTSGLLIDILKFIEENYAKKMDLATISKQFGYTEKYFSKLFKNRTGIGLKEYINRFRIEKAMELRQFSDYSMTRIAEEVGFDSSKTFYRLYKNYHKKT